MKVLVTGATGFIGGNLARLLSKRGYEVRALVRPGSNTLAIDGTGVEQTSGDILDPDSVRRAVRGCEAVFHCAASYTFWTRDPGMVYRTNVEGTRNVLEAAAREQVSRTVYTSTVSTVGYSGSGLANEQSPVNKGHLVGHYKRSKYQAEQVALDMAAQGFPVVIVNPTAPVGSWDVKPTPTGRVLVDFLKRKMPAYLETGLNLVDVRDVAAGHLLAMEKGKPGHRYLLGNRNVSLKELFAILQRVTGLKAPRFKIPYWLAVTAGYVDQAVEGKLMGREPRVPLEGVRIAKEPMYVDCGKAVRELGQPQSPLEAALENAVKWFRDYGYAPARVA